jgi:tellurite resistance protein TehA-like permease
MECGGADGAGLLGLLFAIWIDSLLQRWKRVVRRSVDQSWLIAFVDTIVASLRCHLLEQSDYHRTHKSTSSPYLGLAIYRFLCPIAYGL